MRIKSYFAPSVQAAISIARREFGDDVTLVTSHASSLESRHLGEYEVVFAVEDAHADTSEVSKTQVRKPSTQVIKAAAVEECVQTSLLEPPTPAAEVFADVFQEAIATPLSTEENVPEKLQRIEGLLIEVGLDGPMVRSLMTMIERVTGTSIPAVQTPVEMAIMPQFEETATLETAAPPDLTPAELAFYLSVSVGA